MNFPAEQLARSDPSSYSNADWAQTVAFHVDYTPNFQTKILSTILDLKVVIRKDGTQVLSLDIAGQEVESVVQIDALQGTIINDKVQYDANADKCALGSRFLIALPTTTPTKINDELFYRITYKTSPTASAAQFLAPEASKSGKYPYFYTQCQAIHARSLLIIQDACGSKVSYTATVRLAKSDGELVALMSALSAGEATVEGDYRIFKFNQPFPIAPYLYAIAIGEIETAKVSERCYVHAEPADIKVASKEYAELESTLKTIESICGPYRWNDVYGVVSMPCGFPFGGMENPLVTFMSNSLLPLQRTKLCPSCQCTDTDAVLGLATSVSAHEQSHSWSGNLTTNRSWEDFFMNEGLTVFIEWRTQDKLKGKAYGSLHRLIGWEDLKDSVDMFMEQKLPDYTKLVVDLSGDIDPDDVFSSVPYMKGSAFFIYLETIMGSEERFEAFLKVYFDTFAWKTITHLEFKAFYIQYCQDNGFTEKLSEIDWDTWFYAPGLPPVKPSVDMTLATDAYTIADILATYTQEEKKLRLSTIKNDPTRDLSKWSSTQQVVFLDRVSSKFDEQFNASDNKKAIQNFFKHETLPSIKELIDFGTSPNSELFSRWINLWIKAGGEPSMVLTTQGGQDITLEQSATFLLASVGRMKFVRPLIRMMLKSTTFQPLAAGIFDKCKQQYHIICSTMVEKDIKSSTAAPIY